MTIRISGFVMFWGKGESQYMTFCQTLTDQGKLQEVVSMIQEAVAGVDPRGYANLRFTATGQYRGRPPAYLLSKAHTIEQMMGFIRLFNDLDFRTPLGEPLTAFINDGPI